MSNQIELAGHEGDVVLVNGICYAFTEYTAPIAIPCNDCDPQLSRFYTVTLSGLTGFFSDWNGAKTVEWQSEPDPFFAGAGTIDTGCVWRGTYPDAVLRLCWVDWGGVPDEWLCVLIPNVSISNDSSGSSSAAPAYGDWETAVPNTVIWPGSTDPCDPLPLFPLSSHISCLGGGTPECTALGTTSCVVTKGLEVTAAFNTCEECPS